MIRTSQIVFLFGNYAKFWTTCHVHSQKAAPKYGQSSFGTFVVCVYVTTLKESSILRSNRHKSKDGLMGALTLPFNLLHECLRSRSNGHAFSLGLAHRPPGTGLSQESPPFPPQKAWLPYPPLPLSVPAWVCESTPLGVTASGGA